MRSGGCQHLAGEFLFHCHVAHHYVAGMWGYGRFYNTLQVGAGHTDTMPDLRELPDRQGRMKLGVSSDKLDRDNRRLVREDVQDCR